MQPLSLVIITKNEEHNLERCIRSVPFADEVVVMDSGSTDQTVSLAETLGARVIQQEWLGFEKQKQKVTDAAKNKWVLNLDADEALSLELQSEIQTLLNSEINKDAFEIPRLAWHLGRWIRHGGWYPDFQKRLYNKTTARWGGGELHESVQAKNVGRLKHNIHHFVFSSLSHQVTTNDRYSTLGAEKMIRQGRGSSILPLIFRPIGKFIECYFLKRGFLDGRAGLIIAVGAAYSLFLRYSKVWESQIGKSSDSRVSG